MIKYLIFAAVFGALAWQSVGTAFDNISQRAAVISAAAQ